MAILNRFPQAVFFSGHRHFTLKNQPKTIYQNHFTMFNDSSVRNPITPENRFVGDREGLVVQVFKDKVIVKGRDFTHQKWIDSYTVRVPFQ